MRTLMLKQSNFNIVPLSARFVEEYMPKARGEYVKVYIMLLRYTQIGELGVTSGFLAEVLGLLETDVYKALEYWEKEGLLSMKTLDGAGNLSISLCESDETPVAAAVKPAEPSSNVRKLPVAVHTDEESAGMLMEIEAMMNRPLSTKEMDTFLSFRGDYKFPDEVVILLVQYCVNKGISDLRYMEKVAINWNSMGLTTIALAQQNIKKHEDKWSNYRKILTYLGMKENEVMKPQEDLLEKWFYTYAFTPEMILKACDISFNNIGKGEMKYIDGVLRSWRESDIKTPEEIETKKKVIKGKGKGSAKKDASDFTEREYDYSELEKKLLGRD
ncbi:MAG TPA: DnaD domain protein [Clostridiaceae bacterium]|nr:DnaD domain protein [Clostridiaceae bacterium]